MPWTTGDVDKHKKGLSSAQKKRWVAVANSVLSRCLADGGKESECAASAIRQANGVAGNAMSIHQLQVDEYTIRTEQHQGRPNIVIPVIMMREGVHSGSHGPLFHSAEELGRFIQTWNGIPVVIQHPERDGVNVSANQPEIIDSQTVGRVYNAYMDGDKLRAEAWIDVERITEVSPETLAIIQAQHRLDVSVGVFSEDDLTPGNWNGEEYVGVARGHRPDHLALLPGGTGACSWEDGCGVRANSEQEGGEKELATEEVDLEEEETGKELVDDASCPGADGSDKQKKKKKKDVQADSSASINDLPDSAFAYIESGGTKDESGKTTPRSLRHFPVHDAAHARNALARMNQSPFGSRAKKKILAACKKFGIEVSSNALEVPDDNTELFQMFKDISAEGYAAVQINADVGYRERLSKVQSALDAMDNNTKVHFLQEVYDDTVVYEVMNRQGGPPALYRQAYQVDDKGEVTLTGVATPVVRQVSFVVASSINTNNEGGQQMADEKKPCCPEKVKLLIDSEHAPFEEADRVWLETLDMAQIDKLVVMERDAAVKPEPKTEETQEEKTEPVITNEQAVQVLREQLKTPEDFIKVLPDEMKDQMTSAISLHRAERTKLIATIKTANVGWTDDELKPKTMAELSKIASMVPKPHDYTGLAGGAPVQVNVSEMLLPSFVEIPKEGGK